jgi:hypothetical protein
VGSSPCRPSLKRDTTALGTGILATLSFLAIDSYPENDSEWLPRNIRGYTYIYCTSMCKQPKNAHASSARDARVCVGPGCALNDTGEAGGEPWRAPVSDLGRGCQEDRDCVSQDQSLQKRNLS